MNESLIIKIYFVNIRALLHSPNLAFTAILSSPKATIHYDAAFYPTSDSICYIYANLSIPATSSYETFPFTAFLSLSEGDKLRL